MKQKLFGLLLALGLMVAANLAGAESGNTGTACEPLQSGQTCTPASANAQAAAGEKSPGPGLDLEPGQHFFRRLPDCLNPRENQKIGVKTSAGESGGSV